MLGTELLWKKEAAYVNGYGAGGRSVHRLGGYPGENKDVHPRPGKPYTEQQLVRKRGPCQKKGERRPAQGSPIKPRRRRNRLTLGDFLRQEGSRLRITQTKEGKAKGPVGGGEESVEA